MADFTIRSLKFRNANRLDFTNVDTLEFIAVDSNTSDFAKIPVNVLVSNKIKADNGVIFEYRSDKYYHIGKDYTDAELIQLNTISTALDNMLRAGCTDSDCNSSCASLSTSATNCNNSCEFGCNASSIGNETCTLSSCNASCVSVSNMCVGG